MLCMYHTIPNRYIYPSGDFYSWLFGPGRGGNGLATEPPNLASVPILIRLL